MLSLFITSCIMSLMILSFSMMVSSSRLDPGIKSGRTKAYHVTTSVDPMCTSDGLLSKRDNFDEWFTAFQKSISLATKPAKYKSAKKVTPHHDEIPLIKFAQNAGYTSAAVAVPSLLQPTLETPLGASPLVLSVPNALRLKRGTEISDAYFEELLQPWENLYYYLMYSQWSEWTPVRDVELLDKYFNWCHGKVGPAKRQTKVKSAANICFLRRKPASMPKGLYPHKLHTISDMNEVYLEELYDAWLEIRFFIPSFTWDDMMPNNDFEKIEEFFNWFEMAYNARAKRREIDLQKKLKSTEGFKIQRERSEDSENELKYSARSASVPVLKYEPSIDKDESDDATQVNTAQAFLFCLVTYVLGHAIAAII
ncbi:hypothetical protein BDD12DRAFT_982312 [Trichophaea hybrida]|nr:hypothetical protein BDD12DRAFT_982312 [Trichophaea hybrida]